VGGPRARCLLFNALECLQPSKYQPLRPVLHTIPLYQSAYILHRPSGGRIPTPRSAAVGRRATRGLCTHLVRPEARRAWWWWPLARGTCARRPAAPWCRAVAMDAGRRRYRDGTTIATTPPPPLQRTRAGRGCGGPLESSEVCPAELPFPGGGSATMNLFRFAGGFRAPLPRTSPLPCTRPRR